MGNSSTFAVFGVGLLVCLAIVLCSLVGTHRSILIAISTGFVFAPAITLQIINPGGAGLMSQLFIAAAAALGTVRQFQKVAVDEGTFAVREVDERE